MSPFMSSMLAAPLMEMPPVSKQTPLPMKATGCSPFLAPFQRMITVRLGSRRALADAEQRAHAEFGHRLDVEHVDIDAELPELAGAAREFDRIEHVRRFVDELARDDHAIDDMGLRREGFSRGADIADRNRNLGTQRAVLAVLLLGLVAVEPVGA